MPTRDAFPGVDCAADIARPGSRFLPRRGWARPNSTASSKRAAVTIHLLANVRLRHPVRLVSRLQQRQTDAQNGPLAGDAELAAKQVMPMPLQRAWSCELGGGDAEPVGGSPVPGWFSSSVRLRQFRHEGIEQTGREKPIGVEMREVGGRRSKPAGKLFTSSMTTHDGRHEAGTPPPEQLHRLWVAVRRRCHRPSWCHRRRFRDDDARWSPAPSSVRPGVRDARGKRRK